MDKEIALIFEYKNAPDALKKAAEAHKANSAIYQKAMAQKAKWAKEESNAQKAYVISKREFENQLNEWDPYKVIGVKPEAKA